jgi:hypothetical protein
MRQKRAELEKNPKHVQEVIRKGAEKASVVAKGTMMKVRKAVGLA